MKKLFLITGVLFSSAVMAVCNPFVPGPITASMLNNAIATPCIVSGTAQNLIISNSPISGSSGSFTTLSASSNVSVTGTLSAATINGAGTGLTGTASGLSIGGQAASATSATNIAGGTQYGVLYQSGVGATSSTGAGTAGYVLTSNGTSAPSFQPASSVNLASPGPIGNSTPSTGAFTTLDFSGDVNRGGSLFVRVNDAIKQTLFGTGIPSGITATDVTAFGYHALYAAGSSVGIDETAFGALTLKSDISGSENSAFGDSALTNLISGTNNSAFGSSAGANITVGTFNTAIGVSAMELASGNINDNVAVGVSALNAMTTGANNNVGVGDQAGFAITSGPNNTVIGMQSLYYVTTGSGNIGLGYQAGTAGTTPPSTGSNNIFIGTQSGSNANVTNSVAIGHGAITTASNQVVLGNASTTATYLKGAVVLPSILDGGSRLLVSGTAPTIASGFGTSPSITAHNTAAFYITIGSGGTSNTGVITMPSANAGWACDASDISNAASFVTAENTTTQTSVTLGNYSRTTGLATAWTAGDVIVVKCTAY